MKIFDSIAKRMLHESTKISEETQTAIVATLKKHGYKDDTIDSLLAAIRGVSIGTVYERTHAACVTDIVEYALEDDGYYAITLRISKHVTDEETHNGHIDIEVKDIEPYPPKDGAADTS